MSTRPFIALVVGALLLRPLAVVAAQDTSDTVQGYAPAESPPAPETAAAAAPVAAAASATNPAANQANALSSLGFVEILIPRPAGRLQREIEETKLDMMEADSEIKQRQGLEDQVKAMAEVKKQEISTLDAQRKLAEKAKNDAEVASFEAEKRDAERHKQFLDKQVSLHQAETETAKARKSLAEATRKALELELQLTNRRGERSSGGRGRDDAARQRDPRPGAQNTRGAAVAGGSREAGRRAAPGHRQAPAGAVPGSGRGRRQPLSSSRWVLRLTARPPAGRAECERRGGHGRPRRC